MVYVICAQHDFEKNDSFEMRFLYTLLGPQTKG